VVQAGSATASNYIKWSKVNAGGYAGGSAYDSVNSGISWTARAWDFNFEIWGNQGLIIQDAKVFQGYKVAGDWLITARYIDTFTPYYPNEYIANYFAIQLIDPSGNVLTSNPITEWGNRVGSIYISPGQAASLEWNGSYKVRIQGLFSGSPYTEYSLTSADWLGTDLTQLDSWCYTTADVIATYESTPTSTIAYTTNIAARGKCLNAKGGDIIAAGVPGLMTVRPRIFQIYTTGTNYTAKTGTATNANTIYTNTPTAVGPDAVAAFTRFSNDWLGGIDYKLTISFIALIVMVVIAALTFPFGHTTAANFFCLPILFAFGYFGMSWIWIGMIYLVAAFLVAKKLWIDTGV